MMVKEFSLHSAVTVQEGMTYVVSNSIKQNI